MWSTFLLKLQPICVSHTGSYYWLWQRQRAVVVTTGCTRWSKGSNIQGAGRQTGSMPGEADYHRQSQAGQSSRETRTEPGWREAGSGSSGEAEKRWRVLITWSWNTVADGGEKVWLIRRAVEWLVIKHTHTLNLLTQTFLCQQILTQPNPVWRRVHGIDMSAVGNGYLTSHIILYCFIVLVTLHLFVGLILMIILYKCVKFLVSQKVFPVHQYLEVFLTFVRKLRISLIMTLDDHRGTSEETAFVMEPFTIMGTQTCNLTLKVAVTASDIIWFPTKRFNQHRWLGDFPTDRNQDFDPPSFGSVRNKDLYLTSKTRLKQRTKLWPQVGQWTRDSQPEDSIGAFIYIFH